LPFAQRLPQTVSSQFVIDARPAGVIVGLESGELPVSCFAATESDFEGAFVDVGLSSGTGAGGRCAERRKDAAQDNRVNARLIFPLIEGFLTG
jgi:hypothetical protein